MYAMQRNLKNVTVCELELLPCPRRGWRGFCAALNAALAKPMTKGLQRKMFCYAILTVI